MDLKKEIKKLQRMRDQIKTWTASNDFKDKTKLVEYRRLIETKMEQFKICERETKTKAYSREGLAAAAKLSPEQQKRRTIRKWVQEKLQQIQDQIEGFEAQIESLSSGKKKGKDRDAIDELENQITQHNWHVEKLEMTIRALDNDVIDAEQVEELKEELEYFIESNQDPDFYHDDALYEQLELEEKLASMGKTVSVEVTVNKSSKKKDKHKDDDDGGSSSKTPKKEKKSKSESKSAKKKEKEAQKTAHQQLLAAQQQRQQLLAQQQAAQKAKKEQQRREREQKEQQLQEQRLREEQYQQQQQQQQQQQRQKAQQQEQLLQQQKQQQQLKQQQEQAAEMARQKERDEQRKRQEQLRQKQAVLDKQQQQQKQEKVVEEAGKLDGAVKTQPLHAQVNALGGSMAPQVNMPNQRLQQQGRAQAQAKIPLTGASGSTSAMLSEQSKQQLAMLDSSLSHIPTTADSERPKLYTPQHPCSIPASFPTSVSPLFDSPANFEKLDVDTLFLIFYHQPGTYQQYLAARQLKKNSWRFHKKYLTWFQRHEEPKVKTKDYEVGTYVYFDYETGWCQRIKADFTFEYPYLEKELQPAGKTK